jgi:dTDP-4-dehydrorhamnose reductase
MANGHTGGSYHLSGAPDVSWAEFARAIMAAAGLSCRVEDIMTADYPAAACRPLNSRLDCSTITQEFGVRRRNGGKHLNAS